MYAKYIPTCEENNEYLKYNLMVKYVQHVNYTTRTFEAFKCGALRHKHIDIFKYIYILCRV